jgi:hypothetical protein
MPGVLILEKLILVIFFADMKYYLTNKLEKVNYNPMQ